MTAETQDVVVGTMDGLIKKTWRPMRLEKRLMLDASLPAIAGNVLWLDAADTSTVLDAEGDDASSGAFSGFVTTWRDKSGSGYHVSAAVNQTPVYNLDVLNHNNVLTFDGTNDKMTRLGTASIPGDDLTIFIVFNKTTPGNNRDAMYEVFGGTNRNAMFIGNQANRLGYYVNSTFYDYTTTYTAGDYVLSSVVHDTNAITLYNNGAAAGSAAGLLRGPTTSLYVGDDSSGGDNLQGNIAEMLIYDRNLTADERHDVETYLAGKWGLTITNADPTVATNTGATLDQADDIVITTAMLAGTDADNTEAHLIYTITAVADYGTLENTDTGLTIGLGDSFTQSDIDSGFITYTHDGTANFADNFAFTITDGYEYTAATTFNLTITPSNNAPVIGEWTEISSEDFEGGASGWTNNTTTVGNQYLTRFLGRFGFDVGVATSTEKTFNLSGTQDEVVINFDFYRLDSWDTGESFRIYIDDVLVYQLAFASSVFAAPPDGSSGNVSWHVQETTPFIANFTFGQWNEQLFRYSLTIDTQGADVKLGFSSTLNQSFSDESWGIDNLTVYEVGGQGVPGPFHITENSANGTVVGRINARDSDVADTLSYSITGGTGAGVFAIDANTGIITVINGAALDYEGTTSYTLTVEVTDDGIPAATDSATFTINVLDVPENAAPTINALGPLTLNENAANNTVLGTVTGSDPDGDTITWSITGGNTDNIFAINSTTGAIRVSSNAALNHEWDDQYTLTIQATDNGFGNRTATRNIVVNIQDINESPTFDIPASFMALNPYLRYSPDTGNFYHYISGTTSYAAATTAAAASLLNGVAGHVATITSLDENTFVRGLGSGALWLAASDSAVEGTWLWEGGGAENGATFSIGSVAQGGYYTNWLGGQPDNGSNSDFLEMATSGSWTDVNGGNRAYVIEWEGADVMAALGNGPFAMAENAALNHSVGFVHARDPDSGDVLAYSITGGTGLGLFSVNSVSGEITLTNPGAIDYETATSYTLNMLVTDALGLTGSVAVTINITDINEMPVIDTNAGVTLDEGDNIVITAAMLSASDVDAPPDSALIYTVTNAVDHGTLRNTNSGQTIGQGQTFTQGAINSGYIVYTHNSSETVADSFSFTVTDGTLTTAAQIFNITVTPVNDAPTFDPVTTILQANPGVLYNADTGNFYRYITTTANLSTAQANANAALLNGQGGYVATVTSAAENTYLRSIISSTVWLGGTDSAVEGEWRWQGGAEAGQLFWQGAAGGAVQNGLYAGWNGGEPNNSGGNEDGIELRTNGSWNDTNVNGARAYVIEWDGADVLAPLYNGPYTMAENELAGYIVGTADGYDPDIGDSVTYSITGGTGAAGFSINTSNGQITLTNAAMANFELSATYTIDLRIEDTAGLFDVMTVTINLTDMNDIPVLLDMTDNFVMENSAFDTVVATLSTMDEDPADVHSYSLISNPGNKFAIVGNELRTAGLIDYEQAQSILLTLRVDDGNGGQFDRTVTINIGDQQDTFTPPPNTGISTGNNADIIVPTDDLMPGKSLLQATLSGGDTGQMNAFYGLGEFTQILREYVGDALKNFLTHATASATAQDNSVTPPAELQIVDGPEKLAEPAQDTSAAQFTNLREALQFLSQIDQATKAGPGEQGDALSQQFVDVMTYHEQKQMRLRAALQDS